MERFRLLQSLKALDLGSNSFDLEGIQSLVEALKVNQVRHDLLSSFMSCAASTIADTHRTEPGW